MVRVFGEAGGVFLPSSADELVWCQPLQGLEPACEVVGGHEVGEVLPELVVAFVVEALDRGVLEGSIHALDLAVGPRVLGLGRAVVDVVTRTGKFEGMGSEALALGDGFLDQWDGRSAATRCGELDAVVGEHRVDFVGDSGDQAQQEVFGGRCRRRLMQFDEGELRRSIDGDEHVQLALFGSNLGDVDMKEADGIGLELPADRLVSFDIRQAGNAMALQASMQ